VIKSGISLCEPEDERQNPNRTMRTTVSRITGEESSNEDGRDDYYVLGGEHIGESIARDLQSDVHSVNLIDETHDPGEIPGLRGNPADIEVLKDAGLSDGSTVVVATPEDSQNLLIAQLVRTHFEVSDVLVFVNAPARFDIVADAGHEPVCVTTAVSDALVTALEPTQDVTQTA
jgi:trk system potassium uptake protein TrkA